MINWDKELEKIFNDPLLADVTAPKKRMTSSDRLIAGFQRIVEFVEANGRRPQKDADREERSLYNQLKGILSDPAKKERCRPYDSVGLLDDVSGQMVSEPLSAYGLPVQMPEQQLEAIFADPLLDDVGQTGGSLFDLPDYMKRKLEERREADYVAQRVKCEDFGSFEAGFKAVHAGLKSGKYRLIKFKEAHVAPGRYFVEDGILVYIAGMDQIEKNRHGRKNGRTRCIYENGMESGIYMQTLCKNLYHTGYTVQDLSAVEEDYLKKHFSVTSNDVESGLVYVLRSLSDDPEIKSIPNLYKIGFTTTPLEVRIANAKNEPTYLCADVKVVATWRVYNVKSSTFETLIHKLFNDVQLQITVDGKKPREWFVVPFHVIEQAVNYMINGKSIAYDKNIEQLVVLKEE
ncbi:MAG TPA: GIY-YIG nuclease family protein [Candidatus Prevotella avicola]|uniref:GIY-YIG nuclease family protein n=1 Tax=Candidatus Prevotella avicola TaxID=2838738 RepID=A0A9D2FX02_9BACT|nr:GIY-YIG nuclease family protein [Candidatus Prevotella avicola]